jgi:hypothetical protein
MNGTAEVSQRNGHETRKTYVEQSKVGSHFVGRIVARGVDQLGETGK